MKGNEMNDLRLDLKVCEGCGALWLRTGLADGVYCRACLRRLDGFPSPRERHAGGRKPLVRRVAGCAVRVAAEVTGGAR